MFKHNQTIRRLLPTNCLSVSDHFVGLALKGLASFLSILHEMVKHKLKIFQQMLQNFYHELGRFMLGFLKDFSRV